MSDIKKQILDTIKSDEKLNSFIKELTDEQLDDYLFVLYKQACDNKLCANCMGKKPCERDEENYQSYLTLENDKVIRNLTPCEYIPTFNFDLVDVMFMPTDAFSGEMYYPEERNGFYAEAIKITKGETRRGTYLHGKYGTGKSYLTYTLVSKLAKQGKTVVFCLVPELIRNIKDNLQVHGYLDNLIVKMKKADVLVLDDLGGEMNTSFSRDEILFPILDNRMNDPRKITFITSNYDLEGLRIHFENEKDGANLVAGSRIMERIRAITTLIELKGNNYRETK